MNIAPSLAVAVLTASVSAGQLSVVSVEPAARSISVPTGSDIVLHFDQAVNAATVTSDSFWAFGKWSGPAEGTFLLSDGNQTVTLRPDAPFSAGEQVMVIVSHDLQAMDGTPLRSAGYSFMFWTRARPADFSLQNIDQLSTNAGPESSRPYGGIGTDLDNDGWLDITVVNEDTADLRVFMNQADGTGLYGNTFLQPPSAVGQQASPSEPSDFNHDGNADITVANIAIGQVSILLGNGDGSFGAQQSIGVGGAPRGVAVLDADGDGDIDIVNTNNSSGNMSTMLNDGNGVFGAPSFWEGGGAGEWALAAGDMNEDGILDLVIGARSSQQIVVALGNGDGTFTPSSAVGSGGSVWMLVVGDVNCDGHEDVATCNSGSNSGSILHGDGTGSLSAAQTYAADPFATATDLGDLDGDGYLDWSISSFGGDWFIYRNDGDGTFTFQQEINAPAAAACSVLLDIDGDADLDLALIDEIADTIDLMRNSGTLPRADVNRDGSINVLDLTAVILAWGPCPGHGPCETDIDGSGITGVADLIEVILGWQ